MKFGDWVPQVFFDLIGRVAPGATLLGLLLVELQGPADAVATVRAVLGGSVPATAVTLGILLASYVIGLLLGGIGYAIKDPAELYVRIRKIEVAFPEDGNAGSGIPFRYDAVQRYDPSAGARLAKLSAEKHLCLVLSVGFAALVPVHLAVWSWRLWLPLAGLVLGFLLALLFHRHVSVRQRRLLLNSWALVRKEVEEAMARGGEGPPVGA